MTPSSSSVKWCLFAAACVLYGAGPSAADDGGGGVATAEPRYDGWLCTSSDSAGVCLFKGLLKNALAYALNRRRDTTAGAGLQPQQSKGVEEYLIEQIQNLLSAFTLGFDFPAGVTTPWTLLKSSFLNARGKKNKNLGPMLAAGVAVIAGTLVPLAFGALVMLAGKALMTSLLAITISGMLGLKALFAKNEGGHHKSYSVAPVAHYTDAQYEQEMGIYKGQTEGKMHSSAATYYSGDANLSGYYKAEQDIDGSNQPEYFAPVGHVVAGHPKFNNAVRNNVENNVENHNDKMTAEKIK